MKYNANPFYRMLDKLFEYIIKNRADWRCELCGDRRNGLEAHHIEGRRDLWLRWDLRNGVAVCRGGCHDNAKVKSWLKRTDPKRYWWLVSQRAKTHPGRRIDLEAIEKKLRLQI